MPGSLTTQQKRLAISEVSLRLLQAILIVLAAIAMLVSSNLRPRTNLKEDPRTLAAMAVVTASSTDLGTALVGTAPHNDSQFAELLKEALTKASAGDSNAPVISFQEPHSARLTDQVSDCPAE